MAVIRNLNEIIQNLIDHFRVSQPDLDTKVGTAARDLFVDGPSSQLALLYQELSSISDQQSFRLISGSDLDKLAKNFGVTRKAAYPSSGIALLTFNSIDATININKGDLITASNGFSYAVQNGISVTPSLINFYKSVATKFANNLDFIGIKDKYAVEVTVQATTSGSAGDISKYSLVRTNIPGVSNATNVYNFSGGQDSESDAIFRDRILAKFNGSNIGTAIGYRNTALATNGVTDTYVVEPGDVLMTRDGTIVSTANDGTKTVVSEGTGGKVDLIILGTSLTENVDSFIYQDKSNKRDPSDPKNIIILGQITGDENKTINKKRVDNIKNKTLPAQPVQELLEVTGSLSGTFKEKTIDSYGRISGNYELKKDTGTYAGSPWGFDSFHFISDHISDFSEDKIKGQFNGQDQLTFSDVLKISNVQQNVSITNENSPVTSDRSIIQLLHTPTTNVTRVFNVNTGERYLISNQNLDGTGSINTTGRIKISGNTLPTTSDTLQVDYNWVVSYDQYADFDGRIFTNNYRTVNDSVDWGYSSLVKLEKIKFALNASSTSFVGTSSQSVSSIINCYKFNNYKGSVSLVNSGTFAGRLSVVINNIVDEPKTVDFVNLTNSGTDIYNTAENNGLFSVATEVVGIDIRYVLTIILPTDTSASAGNLVSVYTDKFDTFNVTSSSGNVSGSQITIPASNITTSATELYLYVNYIASTQNLLSITTPSLPASHTSNGFELNKNVGQNNYFNNNLSRKEILVVQQNLSLQNYIELSISDIDTLLTSNGVVSVIRIIDNKELWNSGNIGSITTSSNKYQLILNGYNVPAIGDRVLVIYYANDTKRYQPTTFENDLIKYNLSSLSENLSNNTFYTTIQSFNSESGLTFSVLDPDTNNVLASNTDGYVVALNSMNATFGSALTNFAIPNITSKKVKISGGLISDNNGMFDITAYDVNTNSITIENIYSNINKKQVSIIRMSDGKELWSSSGTINVTGNTLSFPKSTNALINDNVVTLVYNYKNIKKFASRLSVAISDQTVNTGVISIFGTTVTKSADTVFTATSTGLKQNIFEAIRKALKLQSTAPVQSNIKLVKIAKLEKVTTVSLGSDEILSVLATYDIKWSKLRDNSFYSDEFIEDLSLGDFDFTLPSTTNNINNNIAIGDKLRITFYYSTTNDLENLNFTRNGVLYTNKSFALIDKMYISSGFTSSQSTKLTVGYFNQPILGSRYKVFYDYTAPKQNERVTIRYNYNKLINNVTFNVETSRPINADVLVKQAVEIPVNMTMNIVVSDTYKNSVNIVLQNVKDKMLSALTSNSLGQIIDSSDLINLAYTVDGVDRARVLAFNKEGLIGQSLSLTANQNEYFAPSLITINSENR